MPGFHVVVVMFARIAYQLSPERVIYGPAGLRNYFQKLSINPVTWPAGVYTIMSTSGQDWRFYDLFFSFHPWHAVPYAHYGYTMAGKVVDAIAEWQQAFVSMRGYTMEQTPPQLCGTQGFIDTFVRPMSLNCYRLTYVMSNYVQGVCDFYTRFSIDYPEDAYQHMDAPLADPNRWWTIVNEPTASTRTHIIRPGDWRYVPMQLMNGAFPVVARL
jgi:hypothetical protein